MAAGLSLQASELPRFSQLFAEEVERQLTQEQLVGKLYSDGELQSEEITLEMAQMIAQFGPWGQHYPEPQFEGRFELLDQRIVGGHHLKMVLSVGAGNRVVDAIAFNVDTTQWPSTHPLVDLVYRLDINHFSGVSSLQLMVSHLKAVKG